MGNPAVAFRAHPPHDDHVLRAFERAVFAAVFDDAGGVSGADAGRFHQLFDGGGVDVDAWIGGLLSDKGSSRLYDAECEKQGQRNDVDARGFHITISTIICRRTAQEMVAC